MFSYFNFDTYIDNNILSLLLNLKNALLFE